MRYYLLIGLACAFGSGVGFHGLGAQEPASTRSSVEATVPFFQGLGPHKRTVTTDSALAQRYFNQGLAFLHAFNHDEAIRSFEAATQHDPGCAMAWWGIAFANGSHINFPQVPPERASAAWHAFFKSEGHALSLT